MTHDSNGARPRRLTTEFGIPVADNQNSLTAGEAGPVLLQDHVLIEKLAHFNRERIPERVVHAKVHPPGDRQRGRKAHAAVRALLDGGGGEGLGRLRARPAGVRVEVLHRGRGLRPRRQQHADLLHPRSAEVPRLHPFTEARPADQPARSRDDVGLLVPVARVVAPGDVVVRRPGNAADVPSHGWLQQPRIRVGQRRRQAPLGQVPLQDRAGHRVQHRRRR